MLHVQVKHRIPWWKYLLSYFMEFELEKLESQHSGELSVCVSDGRLQLNAERAIYSWEDKYDNFLKAFQFVFEDDNEGLGRGPKVDPFSLLVLGYGMGSIPYMLEKNFGKSFDCTGVELDEDVIYLANKYGGYGLKASVQVVQSSADIFVYTTEETYDIICIDIFIQDKIPPEYLAEGFLTTVKSRLAQGGYIFFNHLSNKEEEQVFSQKYFDTIFKKHFGVSRLLDVGGNYILIGC